MDKIQQIENRVKELEKWKSEKTIQQISFPIDIKSVEVLQKFFMRITGSIEISGGAGSNTFLNYIGNQGSNEFIVSANTYRSYSVDTSTDVFTVTDIYLNDDDVVYFAAGGVSTPSIPAPLVEGTGYFVINTTGKTFQVSATSGGVAINIIDTGTGRQYLYQF